MERLLELLHSVLGKPSKKAGNNYAFHCPNCNHAKKKLEVNLDTEKWQCWVCQQEFRGSKIKSLLKRLKASPELFQTLYEITGNTYNLVKDGEKNHYVFLPKEYIPIWEDSTGPVHRNAFNYLIGRGLTPLDMLKYRIGYAYEGKYRNSIILPSYNDLGELNYYVTRSFYQSYYSNPDVDRDSIIFNELFINWNLPLVLVEGAFDAMAVKRNAIPLLGKGIGSALAKRIILERVKSIYICLDQDAKKQSIHYIEQFLAEGLDVYFVDLPDKDPSKLGFNKVTQIIKQTKKVTYSDLLRLKWETR